MKKILFIIEDLKFGGVEASLVNLLNCIDFDAHDYSITLLMWGKHYDMLDGLKKDKHIKVKILNTKTLDFVFNIIAKFIGESKSELRKNQIVRWLLLKKVKHEDADVIIRYHHAAMKSLFSYLKGHSKNIMWYHISKYGYYLDEKYTSNCDKIVVVNDDCREIMSQADPGLSNKLTVIENLVPYEEINLKADIQEKLFDESLFNIVSCARISPEKGIDIAVDACKILAEKAMDFKWYLIGDAMEETVEYAENIKAMIKENGLEEHFILLGSKKNPYPYFKQCDLYVQASREEALPLTISEAQVCGTAVLSTDTVGGRRWIDNGYNGYIVDISPEALADKIYDLYNNRDKIAQVQKNVKNIDFDDKNRQIMESFYSIIEN